MDGSGGNSTEATLTRFFIFTPSEDLRTWTYRGHADARDRDHACRVFFGPPGDEQIDYVAVSENAWKPKRRPARVRPAAALLDMPDVEPEPEPLEASADGPEPAEPASLLA